MRRKGCPDTEEVTGSNPVSPTSITLVEAVLLKAARRVETVETVAAESEEVVETAVQPTCTPMTARPTTADLR